MSYTAAISLVIAVGVTRILRDDHSAEETALGFLIGGISLFAFAIMRRKAQKITIPWQPIAVLVMFVIGAGYLLSGKHLTAEGAFKSVARQIGAMLKSPTEAP
jgi:uncharacterized membrane protein